MIQRMIYLALLEPGPAAAAALAVRTMGFSLPHVADDDTHYLRRTLSLRTLWCATGAMVRDGLCSARAGSRPEAADILAKDKIHVGNFRASRSTARTHTRAR
jgi:hypothetical protein